MKRMTKALMEIFARRNPLRRHDRALVFPFEEILHGEGSWVELYQRMLVGTITLWLILVAFRLRSISGAAATDPGKSTRNLPGRLGVAKRTRRERTDATDGSKGSGVGDV